MQQYLALREEQGEVLSGDRPLILSQRYTLRSEQEAAIAAYYRVIGEEPDEEDSSDLV